MGYRSREEMKVFENVLKINIATALILAQRSKTYKRELNKFRIDSDSFVVVQTVAC